SCNGSGTCVDNGTTACAPYICGATSCKTTCASGADCTSSNYCNGSTCTAKKGNGATCTAANECTSVNCVDGYCCNTGCGSGASGDCQACNVAGSLGTCTVL